MTYLYRAQIIGYPEFEEYEAFDYRYEPFETTWEKPVGWEPDEDYINRFKSNKYFEPDTSKFYRSRSSAKARVDLLNSMGYEAIVQRSAPVEWPTECKEKVESGQALEVAKAVGVLKRAGIIQSADELF
ncbi:hypothetical protein [Corynebacterium striatum]|uniref:hypothetical protein n=1 Tax=Corynebacterium striatum TaxID=43770 RepID=UPI000D75CD51|nr:hypothetical protein [Corynebacterium striatum]PXY04351.1 hypothetical protein CKF53_09485 [Corynebacterium striatum]PXY04643.1 hypothetical protein CKF53_09450 [Corynebacterium striatum]